MGDLSTVYVGMTRHKGSARLYSTAADRPKMAEKMSTAHFKDTTLDLQPQGAQQTPQNAPQMTQGATKAPSPTQPTSTAQNTPTAPQTSAPTAGAGAAGGGAAAADALIKAAQAGAQRAKEAAEMSGHFARQAQAHNEKVHNELAGMNGGKQKQPELEFE
jgi:hypothetical protein